MMELRTAGYGPFRACEAIPLLPIHYVFPIVVLLLPALGYACSCAWPENVSERYVLDHLCAADAVFVGEIESELTVRDDVFEYKIWPTESFKGRLNSPAFAVSETGGMCGYPFNAQSRYLIFASHRKNTNYLSASICGLTRPLDREDEVYKILVANKDAIEDVCGEEAAAVRRMERLREKGRKRQELEEATRRLWDSKE
jgi:hypothetical protein